MEVADTLAYYNLATITALKSPAVQAPIVCRMLLLAAVSSKFHLQGHSYVLFTVVLCALHSKKLFSYFSS